MEQIILFCRNINAESLRFKIYNRLVQASICLQVASLIFHTVQVDKKSTAIKNTWSVWSNQQMLTDKLLWQLTDEKNQPHQKCLPGSNLKQ